MFASFAKFVKISSYKKKNADMLSKLNIKYYKQYDMYTIPSLSIKYILKLPLRIQQSKPDISKNW